MKPNNANIFICAVNKVSNRFKYYGTGDIMEISLLKLIYKHACYAPSYACLQQLDKMVSKLQLKDNDICIDTINGDFLPLDNSQLNVTGTVSNQAPSVDDYSITVNEDDYVFNILEFTNGFTDPDGDSYGNIIILSLPANGDLFYNEIPVTINQVITDPSLLTYIRDNNNAYNSSFFFSVYDDNENNPMQSNVATMNIVAENIVVNQPPTIGDRNIYKDNRAVTVFSLSDFTSLLEPPYSDPEGDLIDAIRIDEVSTANQGQYLYFGSPVSVGQIIPASDISDGHFTHEGANVNTIQTDSINFSVRDSGSMQFIS